MSEQRMQFAIGVVTLIAGFALAAIIIWFGEFQFALQPRTTYTAFFKYAPGAQAKMPVRRVGVRVGEVRTVEYNQDVGLVFITFVVEGNNRLRTGDYPAFGRELLGDTYLDIRTDPEERGQKNRQPIPTDKPLEGVSPPDLSQTLDQAVDMIPAVNRTIEDYRAMAHEWTNVAERANRVIENNERNINVIVQDTRESMERLAVTLESINNVLTPESQENLRVTMQNIRDASDDLGPVIQSSREAIEQITSTTSKLDDVAQNLTRVTKPMAEKSESTMTNLDQSAESMNFLLADLRVLTHHLRTQDGTIQRLAKDPSLYQNLDDSAFMMLRSLGELERIMADLKVFADKIARHPGELGVQGVLSKDKGLKNVEPGSIGARRKHSLRK